LLSIIPGGREDSIVEKGDGLADLHHDPGALYTSNITSLMCVLYVVCNNRFNQRHISSSKTFT